MEKFLNLSVEKQNVIIDAALKAFSKNGYKKTSTSDIAKAAGISKGMIFHYFGTKKALYLYLINFCGNLITKEIGEKFNYKITDFFDRIKLTTSIEISILKKHPASTTFLTSMYFEEDEEVKEDIKAILTEGENFRNIIAYDNIDYSKFKDGVDIKLLMKMLTWIGDGYAKQLSSKVEIDYDDLNKEFEACLDLLKNNLYKEKYI